LERIGGEEQENRGSGCCLHARLDIGWKIFNYVRRGNIDIIDGNKRSGGKIYFLVGKLEGVEFLWMEKYFSLYIFNFYILEF
jgi:hypothetical protein